MQMENNKYAEIKERLKNVLKTAKKLGLQVQPGGGYTMGYDINRLPDFPVGLFGALSIIEGPGARCKLGLTFDETEALEAGFNGTPVNAGKKKKKRSAPINKELMIIGMDLSQLVYKKPRGGGLYRASNFISDNFAAPAMPKPKIQKAAQIGVIKDVVVPAQAPAMVMMDNWGNVVEPKIVEKAAAKNKMLEKMLSDLKAVEAKVAQAVPGQGGQDISQEELDALLAATEEALNKKKKKSFEWEDDGWQDFDADLPPVKMEVKMAAGEAEAMPEFDGEHEWKFGPENDDEEE